MQASVMTKAVPVCNCGRRKGGQEREREREREGGKEGKKEGRERDILGELVRILQRIEEIRCSYIREKEKKLTHVTIVT